VEGRLAREELTRIEDYLRENPDIAAQVEKLRDQARRMRKFGRALLSEDIPQRLSDIVPRKPK
jgi:anti-sigma factor RsiW